MMRNFKLNSLAIIDETKPTGINPAQKVYSAEFSFEWEGQTIELAVPVQTESGWDAAKTLACERIGKLGDWLANAALHEKSGPHTIKYL